MRLCLLVLLFPLQAFSQDLGTLRRISVSLDTVKTLTTSKIITKKQQDNGYKLYLAKIPNQTFTDPDAFASYLKEQEGIPGVLIFTNFHGTKLVGLGLY